MDKELNKKFKEIDKGIKEARKDLKEFNKNIKNFIEPRALKRNMSDKELYIKTKEAFKDALNDEQFIKEEVNADIKQQEEDIEDAYFLSRYVQDNKDFLERFKQSEDFKEMDEEEQQAFIKTFTQDLTEEEIKNTLYQGIDILRSDLDEFIASINTPVYKDYINDLLDNDTLKYDFFVDYRQIVEIVLNGIRVEDSNQENKDIVISYASKEFTEEIINKLKYKSRLISQKLRSVTNDKDIISYGFNTPLKLNETLIMSDTELIDNMLITNNAFNNYELQVKSVEDSNNIINNLNDLDKWILDTIVLEFYIKQSKTIFTDRDIALVLCKEKANQTISDKMLEDIKASIKRLQEKRISLDWEDKKKLQENNKGYEDDNPLLWIKTRKARAKEKTTLYQLVGVPFYADFISITKPPLIEYRRDIVYREIEGIDKSIKNQTIRLYLNRQFLKVKGFNLNNMYISVQEIYKLADAKTNKQKQDARKVTEAILKSLKTDYNYNYKTDNIGNRGQVRGYEITFIYPKNDKKEG